MSTVVTIIVVVLVLAGVAAYFLWRGGRLGSRSNAKNFQRRYGREYDRLYATHGDHAAVEQELEQRERDRSGLTIRELEAADRERLTEAWASAQANFVEDPGGSARRAEQLVGETLTLRGYPAEDPERQLALASVDHTHSLAEFRDGHELLQRSNTGALDVDATEQLRQAMLRSRVFFDDLVGGGATKSTARRNRDETERVVA
jgi:hypothetical protein